MWNTSRIFSSARWSAGEGGSLGVADTMVGAPAVIEGGAGAGSLGGRMSSSASPERRITIVGTPSSALVTPADWEDAGTGTVSVLPGPAAARASSSELRLNSCQIGHVRLTAVQPPHPRSTAPLAVLPHSLTACTMLQSCTLPGSSLNNCDPSERRCGSKKTR